MKRDMDLVRDLLLRIEGDPLFDGTTWVRIESPEELGITGHSPKEVAYHLDLLIEEKFIKGSSDIQPMPMINNLTWKGHEFLDNIRDNGIWSKTKERIKGLPSVAISLVAQIAEAEIKKHLLL
jgi:hypothetical protein